MIDLFEHLQTIDNKELHSMIDLFSEMENDYNTCSKLVSELNKIGYTCEYGLDAQPHSLRKIN